jgi:hypothetical protein
MANHKFKIPLTLFLAGLLCTAGGDGDAWAEEAAEDPMRNGVRLSQLSSHPVRSVGYWQKGDHFKPRQVNIGPAPPELIEFMHLDNAFQGYSERPVPVNRDSEILRDVVAAMASLPRAIRRIAERRLFYIALVRDLGGGTGYMDVVAGADGSAAGGFIVLDEGALSRTANAWASWRENSAFQPGAGWHIEVGIEASENDTRVNAIRYILLHELGHVVDAVLGVTQIGGGNTQNIADNGFYVLSWTHPPPSQTTVLHGDENRSRFDDAWPDRQKLGFYSFDASVFGIDDVVPLYEWLKGTNFPTLYAASSSAEDFAESFVNYVHVVMDGRPFEIRLRTGGDSEFLFGSCWDAPLCAGKRATMKRLIQRAEILH